MHYYLLCIFMLEEAVEDGSSMAKMKKDDIEKNLLG
jgi:hypothetical protein